MNISVKGEYALQAIFDLCSRPAGQPVRQLSIVSIIVRRRAARERRVIDANKFGDEFGSLPLPCEIGG